MFVVAGAFLSLAVLVLTNIFDAMNDSSDALYVRGALLLAAIGVVPLAVGLWLVRWR
jgi:cadmium resistance protein CadD (predicted permease)